MHKKLAEKFIMMVLALGVTLALAGFMSADVYADTNDAADPGTEISVTQMDEDADAADSEEVPGDDTDSEDPVDPGDPEVPGDPEDSEEPEEIITGWHEGFYYDAEGNRVVSQVLKIDGVLYIFNARGDSDLYNDIWVADDGTVYLIKEGVADSETVYIYDGKLYKNGAPLSGVFKSFYYKNGSLSSEHKNAVKKVEDGNFYYFNADGTIYRGTKWLAIGSNRYYIKDGKACTGWAYIDGYKYRFYTSTATLCQDLISNFPGEKWMEKVVLIKVNRKMNCVTLYANDGANGAIIPVKALICSVGLPSTPTITGTYTLTPSKTYRWHRLGGPDMGGYVWGQYCTRINGSYLFHSVTYRSENNPATLVTSAYNNLGKAASHGCVRLQVIDAKLIYDIVNLKKNTVRVMIYDSNSVGPFDKPVIGKVSAGTKWEPTDPNRPR